MVGQGFGPLHMPKLVAQARVVLPHIDFIGIREDQASLPLLLSLGVAPDRVLTTGDDASQAAIMPPYSPWQMAYRASD